MENKKVLSIISFIFSTLSFIIGFIILPFISDIGVIVVRYILAALILYYVIMVLLYRALKRTGVNKLLAIIEIILDMIIVVSLFLNLKILMFNNLFFIIELFLLIHAVSSIITGFYINNIVPKKYSIYLLLLDLSIVILSVLGFNNHIFNNTHLIIVTSCFCFISSIIALSFGIIILRKKNKSS